MHRIDGPGATIDNEFTEGNPALGTPATTVTDDWLNDVQEELMSVLAAGAVAPVKGTQNQVLAALKAAGVFQGVEVVTTNRTLTAADAGKYFFSNANSLIYTLPDPATLLLGTTFRITQGKLTSGGTINAPGGATIGNITAGGTVTSVAMMQSTEYVLTVVSSTAYQLTAIGGPASLTPNGSQQWHSGLIIQWGQIAFSSGTSNVTFSRAFTTQVFAVVAGDTSAPGNLVYVGADAPTLTGFTARSSSASDTSAGRYIAIGY